MAPRPPRMTDDELEAFLEHPGDASPEQVLELARELLALRGAIRELEAERHHRGRD